MGAAPYGTSGRLDRKDIAAAKKMVADTSGWVPDRYGGQRLYAARSQDPQVEALTMKFREVQESCRYEYGHGGYTGTFAEKHDLTVYRLKVNLTELQWKRLKDMVKVGLKRWDDKADGGFGAMVPRAPLKPEVNLMRKLGITTATINEMADVYEDKWGPALGLITPDNRYWMGGWCSE